MTNKLNININDFKNILEHWSVNENIIKIILNKNDSPLNYAFRTIRKDIREENSLEHSYSVLINCENIIKESELNLSKTDKLILFYASLLHDIAKSLNNAIRTEIEHYISKQCKLFAHKNADHGIRGAHYIEKKLNINRIAERIRVYGLEKEDVKNLLNIIAFHSTGRIHPCFVHSGKISRRLILLCLIFWVADIADAYSFRKAASTTVTQRFQDISTRVRKEVEEVKILKNSILWGVKKITPQIKNGVNWENAKLAQHRVLLQAFNLPNYIIPVECSKIKNRRDRERYINYSDIILANLCFDVSSRCTPLSLSANTLPELYERIIEAFYRISVTDELMPKHYFGPIVLEVKNVEKDRKDEINIRGKEDNFKILESYTQTWLADGKKESDKFYFGYTHGQRIKKYLHIMNTTDLNNALQYMNASTRDDKERCKDFFKNWSGEISQIKNVVNILKKERNKARRAYVVIPHVVLDNPESKFYVPEEVAPSLIAIQFMIERGPKLSAFLLLRAQELSTFFIVNYLEARKLLEELKRSLNKKSQKKIKLGRIVMLSAFGYFQPNTVLLNKPQICKQTESEIQKICNNIATDDEEKQKFINLLEEFKKDFIKIETGWCSKFANFLRDKDYINLSNHMKRLEKTLNSLENKRIKGGYSASYIRNEKKKAITKFINIIKQGSW